MKKRIIKITWVVLTVVMTIFVCHSCHRRIARPWLELSWRHFVKNLASQQYDDAFSAMSQSYRASHTVTDFIQAWSDYQYQQHLVTGNRDITAVYIGLLSPIGNRAKLFVSTSHLFLPLPLEDGFMGIHVDLVRENGSWKIDGFPFHIEGR